MNGRDKDSIRAPEGILLREASARDAAIAHGKCQAWLRNLRLDTHAELDLGLQGGDRVLRLRLRPEWAAQWAPDGDTMGLCDQLGLDTLNNVTDLEREILAAMLLAPVAMEFPSHEELVSAVNIRRNIVLAARRTTLDFHTTEAERPEDCWTYHEDTGFTLLPRKSLIEALRKATQPEASGRLYSFSCYRATEYVILLAIAQELQDCHPELLAQLECQWEKRAIMSGQFHDTFLREYGSMENPLPPKYYVPGDRVWFRNPDAHSSDVTGYEGSWVFYLGNNRFTNFWKPGKTYTLAEKCLELYHWRHGVARDAAGELQMDERVVEARVNQSLSDAEETARILDRMLRLRDPKGVYAEGGCMDTSREYPRCVRPGTNELFFPDGMAIAVPRHVRNQSA